jgi:hypothetical protein
MDVIGSIKTGGVIASGTVTVSRGCWNVILASLPTFTLILANPAVASSCPDTAPRIDENAICNPGGEKTKACDASYEAPSRGWLACYRAVSDCRERVSSQNKEISAKNAMVYQCKASVASQLVKSQGVGVAHSPGIVPPIKQPSTMTCWATVAAMMYSWKQSRSTQIDELLGSLDPSYKLKFQMNEGLGAAEKADFLARMGLTAEAPQNLDAQGWAKLIKDHGPLWITTNEGSGANFSIHARIITGIFGDGSSAGSTAVIVDPADGKVHVESLKSFVQKFEDVARIDLGSTGELRPQIVHY